MTALVSSAEREQEARELRADEVVTSLDDERLEPFHLVLDGIGGPVVREAVGHLVPGGTVATYGTLGGPIELGLFDFANAPNARVIGFFHSVPEDEKGADLATLAGFVADGRLRPRVSMVRPWEETVEVLDALRERRVRGKAVLTCHNDR